MRKNIYVAYVSVEESTYEVRDYSTDECVKMTPAQYGTFLRNCPPATIFQNNLNITVTLFPGGVTSGKKLSKDEKSCEYIEYKIHDVTLRSFSVLCPSDICAVDMLNMYGVKTPTEAMIAHIKKLGGFDGISRTICGQSLKIFYSDIKDELWQLKKQNKVYINSIEMFNMCHAGPKCGMLSKISSIEPHGKTVDYDLSAAYCGAFVQSNKFPIGRPHMTADPHVFLRELRNGNNAKLIYKGIIPEVEEAQKKIQYDYYDDFNNVTALELCDLQILHDLGVDIVEITRKYNCTYLYYDETGYIDERVRDKIVGLQGKKDVLEKGTPERSLVKCQMEFIYGKPIQKRTFNSNEEVVRNYRKRGENYITPQMSNHAAAYVRFQIYKAIKALGDDVYYWDTDGIAVADNDKTNEYFAEQNRILHELNRKSGYESNIGTWKHENFDEFLAIRPKIYVTRNDTDIKITAAGMDDFAKEYSLCLIKTFGESDPCAWIAKHGLPFLTKKVVCDKENLILHVRYDKAKWLR